MTSRDVLARHLYIHAYDGQAVTDDWRQALAQEWDAGLATLGDMADCYAQADAQLVSTDEVDEP